MSAAVNPNPARAGLPSVAPTAAGTNRQRFLDAAGCRATDRPPIWMMRQAGRCLPEYRALKERHSFLELVRTPELATEVTLQPIRRFGFDAAILFCDILVIPEAMGQSYHFREAGGVEMEFALRDAADIARLSTDAVEDRLQYVADALRLLKKELGNRTALLGFAGSPWTLANFMLDGGSSKNHTGALRLLREDPALLRTLLEKLTTAVTRFLRAQITAGADAVQIFDTHGALLPAELFEAGSGEWMRRIIAALGGTVPVIAFSKGTRDWKSLTTLGATVLGIDAALELSEVRQLVPENIALQGNLDPEFLLNLAPDELEAKTNQILQQMQGRPGYIFNLGHGVPPATPLENIARVVETVQSFKSENRA